MWFLLIFLKSRDVKTWCRTSKRSTSHRSGISWGTFCNQPEVSATSGSKVMAIIWFSQKWWPWPCPSSDCQKKKFCIVACPEDIFCKRNQDDRRSGAACRAFEDGQTDKQTDRHTHRHTDRGDQYTLRKVFRKVIRGAIIGYISYYIDFSWPWPLTLTFDLDLDLHLFCKKKT